MRADYGGEGGFGMRCCGGWWSRVGGLRWWGGEFTEGRGRFGLAG